MNTVVNIGRTVARERRRVGITQEQLADHLGVSKAAVFKWELGQSVPDVGLLPRIAAYFSLTLDKLFDWHDELTQEESAARYAEVYALGEKDLAAAHARLRELAAAHHSDANLLLMLASLLTMWAGGMATPFVPACKRGGEPEGELAPAALIDEALVLLDRVLGTSDDPSTLYLTRQQKATTLFQAERYGDAAALLEQLVRRQDEGAPTMLLASAYRKLGREDDALDLLQMERLRAANFVLSSLMQEVGMRGDAAFACAAGKAAESAFCALDMETVNPYYLVTVQLEVAETLRDAGEKEAALEALHRAVAAMERVDSESADLTESPLWDRVAGRLDPARAGEAWAEHKGRQAAQLQAIMRQGVAERLRSPEWRAFADDDARYREIAMGWLGTCSVQPI
ncbi:helix-turn-helix transcriptional regulator [Collinsella tanakaei]|uniref:helix-turn-helix domain-containing protein n=1 Tax=Collinsella tanakaei TaxID=626935 RepID=UPI00195CF092|nr:helix-turn-helix transcriptional regulator [Collinsella tanakaei]MBM6779484.1 helix-turn-helix transcriptional regulator [Collinsella tanakaei]